MSELQYRQFYESEDGLINNPSDWALRGIFADWLEDLDALIFDKPSLVLAKGQRWQIEQGKYPQKICSETWGFNSDSPRTARSILTQRRKSRLRYLLSGLMLQNQWPKYSILPFGTIDGSRNWIWKKMWRAEAALAMELAKRVNK